LNFTLTASSESAAASTSSKLMEERKTKAAFEFCVFDVKVGNDEQEVED